MIEVWNKTDLLDEDQLETVSNAAERQSQVVLASAISEAGLDDLTGAIEDILMQASHIETFDLTNDVGRRRAWLYENCNVLSEEQDGDQSTITVQLSAVDKGRFEALSKN